MNSFNANAVPLLVNTPGGVIDLNTATSEQKVYIWQIVKANSLGISPVGVTVTHTEIATDPHFAKNVVNYILQNLTPQLPLTADQAVELGNRIGTMMQDRGVLQAAGGK